ncbi:hypothetical protein MNBD_CHLOROFLEXI01-2230 [hydrothermal vent metagenome]|uniref:Uncharacterized protein n=1 Tax=hydrothermal vent metagenome TaxID=652676 RepID=A0A3B0V6Y4_9ZZZZ
MTTSSWPVGNENWRDETVVVDGETAVNEVTVLQNGLVEVKVIQ